MKAETKRALAIGLIICHWVTLLHSQAPEWWGLRQVRISGQPAEDYALINQGQLKNLAYAAYLEMEDRLPNGAGPQILGLIQSWLSPGIAERDDYAVVTIGQLKAVAVQFHNRLQENGVSIPYTWTSTTTDDDDYSPANIGQAKAMFAFNIGNMSNGEGYPPENTGQSSVTLADGDEDGIADVDEARFGLNGAEGDDSLDGSQIFHPNVLGYLEAVSVHSPHVYALDNEANILSVTP